jgi:hypothetical protein
MKKYACALALLVTFGAFAQSATETVLQKSMKPFQPLSISDSKGIVTLTMNEDQITDTIYKTVITNAICGPRWLDDKNTAYLKNTKEIRVLNKHNYIGYVFEEPSASCDELGKAKDDTAGIIIYSHTHWHPNK